MLGKKKMSSVIGRSVSESRFVLAVIGYVIAMAPSAFANPWSCTLGDARMVQYRTKDIADRLNREFPYCQATMVALQMDNAACQLVDAVQSNASWQQVQASLSRTCALAGQVNALSNSDGHVRNDRLIREFINDLSRRIERLRNNLDKAYERTQPKFCPPPVSSYRPSWNAPTQPDPFAVDSSIGWKRHFQMPSMPSRFHNYGAFPTGDPRYTDLRFNLSSNFPSENYEHDFHLHDERRFESPLPFSGNRPQIPTEYRVERNVTSQNPRAGAVVQLGLQALRLISDGR